MPNSNFNPPVEIYARPLNFGTWHTIAATDGTDVACTNGTLYYGSIYVPANCHINGVQFLVGSVGGTTKVIATIHNIGGDVLASTAIAGITVGTAAQVQQVALTLTGVGTAAVASGGYDMVGPRHLLIGLTFNGTTAKFRAVPAQCQAGIGMMGGSYAQTFGTTANIIPSSTAFTADTCPVASIY